MDHIRNGTRSSGFGYASLYAGSRLASDSARTSTDYMPAGVPTRARVDDATDAARLATHSRAGGAADLSRPATLPSHYTRGGAQLHADGGVITMPGLGSIVSGDVTRRVYPDPVAFAPARSSDLSFARARAVEQAPAPRSSNARGPPGLHATLSSSVDVSHAPAFSASTGTVRVQHGWADHPDTKAHTRVPVRAGVSGSATMTVAHTSVPSMAPSRIPIAARSLRDGTSSRQSSRGVGDPLPSHSISVPLSPSATERYLATGAAAASIQRSSAGYGQPAQATQSSISAAADAAAASINRSQKRAFSAGPRPPRAKDAASAEASKVDAQQTASRAAPGSYASTDTQPERHWESRRLVQRANSGEHATSAVPASAPKQSAQTTEVSRRTAGAAVADAGAPPLQSLVSSKLSELSAPSRSTHVDGAATTTQLSEAVGSGIRAVRGLSATRSSLGAPPVSRTALRTSPVVTAGETKLDVSDGDDDEDVDEPPISSRLTLLHRKRAPSVGRQPAFQPASAHAGLVGLENLGNTCFMNSCLQCLSNIPALTQYFVSHAFMKHLNRRSSTKGEVALAYGELMDAMWGASRPGMAVRPSRVKHVVGSVASRFLGYDQQDAQEFLRFLVDALHDDTNRVVTKPAYRELVERPVPDADMSTEWWEYYSARHDSVVKDLFAGQLKTQVTCKVCGTVSRAFDPFWDLAVPIPKAAQARHALSGRSYGLSTDDAPVACSITDCLRAFTQEEDLAGSEAPRCTRCGRSAPAKKRMTLYRLPPVLVLHIKRFTFSTYRRTKLTTAVDYPEDDLDLHEFVDASSEFAAGDGLYDLAAVSCHSGSLGGGHYTALARVARAGRPIGDGTWATFNDSHVTTHSRAPSAPVAAYLLFYVARRGGVHPAQGEDGYGDGSAARPHM